MAAIVLVPIAAAMMFGVWSMSISVFGGYDFTGALWTLAGFDISVALLVVVGGVAWIFATNLANQRTDMGEYEFAIVAISLLLPILYVFVPTVESLITWHDMMRLAATMWVSGGTVYVSYIG